MPIPQPISPSHAGVLALSILRGPQAKLRAIAKDRATDGDKLIKAIMTTAKSAHFDRIDVVSEIQKGLPGNTVGLLEGLLAVTTKELSGIIDREDKTVRSWVQRKLLDQTASEKLFRLLKVFVAACLMFEDANDAIVYLKTVSPALGGKRPIDLLANGEGEALVLYNLAQLEYGQPF